jgi:hypothetical protein
MKAKPEDVNMSLVVFGITRILTDSIGPKKSRALVLNYIAIAVQCPRRFLGIIGQNPSVSESSQL